MKILGIDPGYGILGWSIIEKNMKIVVFGTIQTKVNSPIEDRLFEIHKSLTQIIDLYKPDFAAIEKLYFAQSTTTALDVAKAIGVILLTLKTADINFVEFAPKQIKKAITGSGSASKSQMQFMVKKIFNLKEIPKPDDAADACAIAACGAMSL